MVVTLSFIKGVIARLLSRIETEMNFLAAPEVGRYLPALQLRSAHHAGFSQPLSRPSIAICSDLENGNRVGFQFH
jgi:hypothetical protein